MRFLVIDEADRMIENGHFAELENIVRLTQRDIGSVTQLDFELGKALIFCGLDSQTQGPDDDDPIFATATSILSETPARDDMQTFVFSATLSKDLQQNLKHRSRAPAKKGRGKKASALGRSSRHPRP